jgi:hypothetical protein
LDSESSSDQHLREWACVAILAASFLAAPALADTKTPGARLRRVSQGLETIAGRDRSTRYLGGTAEVLAGGGLVYTGVELVAGSIKFGKDPERGKTGNYAQDLGSAFIDAYSRPLGAPLGVIVGGVMTAGGVALGLDGLSSFAHPSVAQRYYDSEFQTLPQKTEAEVLAKATAGEKRLSEFASSARHARLLAGWTSLAAGSLVLIAATAHPEDPAGFFIGGAGGVYGLVTLFSESTAESEFADYEAWRTDTPREASSPRHLALAAIPTPHSLGMGLSWRF